jgi:hypothetical protein
MTPIERKALGRRTFLQGVGGAVALPFLDAMAPAMSAAPQAPVRMAMVYVPNGIIMQEWNPAAEGALGPLGRVLKPMEPLKEDILLLGNLTHNAGRALLDGAGDHGRCCGTYLTGVHVKKSLSDIHAGISFDQIIANQTCSKMRFPSLEIGMEDGRQAGDCDSGYSCAYTNNLAWKSETVPLPPTLNPRDLFERLFGDGVILSPEARKRQALYRRSILDFVNESTHSLEGKLGPSDRRKLDEYLSAIREIERQIEAAEATNAQIDPHMDKPYGIPADFAEHFRLMTDMITIAFQADMTRIVTFLVTREGSSRAYREIDIPDGHHPLTHHRNQPDLIEKVTQINTYHVQQFAKWATKLKNTKDGDSNLLDSSMIVYGAGLSDGNRHLHEDLPTMIAGGAGGAFKTGRYIEYRRETPMCNLFLTMMDRMGVHIEDFGDSTGRVTGLDGGLNLG